MKSTITIRKTGINGEGIGYLNKIPVFVSGALIDETVEVDIVDSDKNYKTGKIKRIIKRSPKRIKPVCENYSYCGGCSLMHTDYPNQLEIKRELLMEALGKYADIDQEFDIVPSNKTLHYRNSLKLPFTYRNGRLSLGIYNEGSNTIRAIDSCLVHSELLERLKGEILEILNRHNLGAYDRKTRKGLRYLVLREIGKRAHLCIVTGDDVIRKEIVDEIDGIKEIVSIYQCINTSRNTNNLFSNRMVHLAGGKHLSFKIDDLRMNLSVRSFFQLNTDQAKRLYRYVSELIDDNQNLIVEAYSGIGAMSLLQRDKAKEIVGIECIEDAVVNANINARINKAENVHFICGDAAEVLVKEFRKRHIDTLIVDPPRSGLDDEMLDALMNCDIERIIYISCNPSTLGKNLDILLSRYSIDSIKAFDMFPNTSHIESVTVLTRDR